jgi:alkyl hydroperoxide reductase subunit AhpC
MYDRFKDKGFEIVGVSLDDNRDAWLQAIADDGLGWIHVSDLGGWGNVVAQRYGVTSIPHTVLVGADGAIIAKNLRGAALEAKVAEVLGATE